MVQFLAKKNFFRILAYRKMKNNLNMFWINEELNRTKKNPFEHNFFPFYEFLAPETDIMVQFLEPETDVMFSFWLQK